MNADRMDDLEHWLQPFFAGLSHRARRRMCPLCIAGLIGPGGRKSVQAIAARADDLGYDQAGFLVIDGTALPKKGHYSVGVAPQYASSLGKTSNCQSLVSVTLASREVPVMVGLRLFLPDAWTNDPERMKRARVPKDRHVALTKPEIAIEEIDRVIASGSRSGWTCHVAVRRQKPDLPFPIQRSSNKAGPSKAV